MAPNNKLNSFSGARVDRSIRNVRTLVFAILSLTGVLCCFAQATLNPIETIQAALRARDYDRALYIAQSALNKRPNDFRILTLEGVILALKGNPETALAAFNKALTIAPHYLEAMRGAAQLEYQLGDPRAKNLLKQTVIAAPHDETAHAMLGVIAQQENDCGTAANEFQDAGSVIWSDHQALEIYGYCLEQLKKPPQAVPIFARLLWLAPHNNDVRYDLAVVQLQAGDTKGTIDTLAPLLAGDIADTDVLSLASDAYEAAGDTPRAVALLRQAIVLKPTNSNNYLAFAALSFDHSSFQVGVDMLDAGLQRLPQDSSLYLARGMLYVQIDDFAKAQADFTRAERLNPGQSLGQYAQGLLELSKHNPDEALKVVRTELEKRPDDALLHYLLARVLHERGGEPGTTEFQEALGAALSCPARSKPGLCARPTILSVPRRRPE